MRVLQIVIAAALGAVIAQLIIRGVNANDTGMILSGVGLALLLALLYTWVWRLIEDQ